MTDTEQMKRLQELIADKQVQNFPETTGEGIMKLLEIRNLITALAPRIFQQDTRK